MMIDLSDLRFCNCVHMFRGYGSTRFLRIAAMFVEKQFDDKG